MNLPEPAKAVPAFNVPGPILWLIVGLALAHVIRAALPEQQGFEVLVRYALIPALYSQEWLSANNVDPGSFGELIVRPFSYMAVHGDYTHLGINLLWLVAFGPVVARRFGALRFYLFFLACGLGGVFMHLATNWASPVPVVGASAAISGLMAAGMRMLPIGASFNQAPANDVALAPLLSRSVLAFSATWIVLNIVIGITGFGAGMDGGVRLIAWEAHLGGYFAGYLLAGPFDSWSPRPRHA